MANKKTSIGGQALMEGIMMRGPEKTAMAVRNASGVIVFEEWETESKVPKICKCPIIRGVYGMVTSMILGYKCMMKSADIAISDAIEEEERAAKEAGSKSESPAPAEEGGRENSGAEIDPEVNSDAEKAEKSENHTDSAGKSLKAEPSPTSGKSDDAKKGSGFINILMTFSVIIGVILMVGLFVFIPTLLGRLIFGEELDGLSAFGRSVFEGVLKVVLLVLYMWGISFMKDIRRTFRYHGAEHKTIFCYEHGLPLTVENVRIQGRFHPRCGTSFLILMLIVGIFIGFFIPISSPILRTLIKILLLPLTVGIGYELIKFAGRHDNLLTKIISAPGVALQHITVLEPDDGMIECAIKAMNAVIPEDREKDNW